MPDLLERLKSAVADRYGIEREVGRGGMATVYLAKDLKHKRKVAIKVLHPQIAATLGTDRFLREIQIAAGLEHPHILSLFDSGEADRLPYYVMPYIKGESVRERLEREGPLPIDEALSIAGDVANGLDYAHREGVVHRDIKPGNILLSEGHALIADFGVARALGAASTGDATATGIAVGTPKYMSPEQAAGATEIDGRADIYALGCVLWEMLAGAPPFDGPTPASILARKTATATPEVRKVRKAVPFELEGVLTKALAPIPADRFRTASEMAEALESSELVKGRSQRRRVLRRMLDVGIAVAFLAAGIWLTGLFRADEAELESPATTEYEEVQVTQDGSVQAAAISPDGQYLAYCTEPVWGLGEAKLLLAEIAKPESARTKALLYSCGRRIRWLSDGSAFVFSGNIQGRRGQFRIPRRFGSPREVTCGDYGASFVVSPDGTQCASQSSQDKHILITSLDGLSAADTVPIAGDYVVLRVVEWLAGNRLAFMTIFGGVQTIWTIGLDGGDRQSVMTMENPVLWRWAPDGSAVYYVADQDLMRLPVSANGVLDSEPELLTTLGGPVSDMSLAADARRLVFRRTAVSHSRLVHVSADPTEGPPASVVAPLMDWTEDLDYLFSVSNDGEWVAYSTGNGVFKVPVRGGDPERLATGGSSPVWSPDDSYLSFVADWQGADRQWVTRADRWSYPTMIDDDVPAGFMLRWEGQRLLSITTSPPNVRVLEDLQVWDPEQQGWQPLDSVDLWDSKRGVKATGRFLLPNDSVGLFVYSLYPGPPDGSHLLGWQRTMDGSRATDSTVYTWSWLVSSDGSEQTRLPRAFGEFLGWTSDGKGFYGLGDDMRSFYRQSLDGGETRLLLKMPTSESFPCWLRPGTSEPEFVCQQKRRESDAWLIENFDPHVN